MALSIQTQPAILGYNITKPQLSIEQPKATVEGSLTLTKTKIVATLPKVQISQEQAFNESGLKNVRAFGEDAVNYAKSKMHESVGRIAEQGTQMANIHLGGNVFAQQAAYNAFDQFDHEFGMVTMPRSGAQISVQEGSLDIQVTDGKITGKIRARKPILDHKPGKLEIFMKQYNSISINFEGENLDLKL